MLSTFWGTDKPVLAVDLDGTLCEETGSENWKHYAEAKPRMAEIEALRKVSSKYFIVVWTSRFEADRCVTTFWLSENNVPYDRLIMGKMLYSVIVDANARSSLGEVE